MSGLDTVSMPHNVPEVRETLVNAPAWAGGMTLGTYPHPLPDGYLDLVSALPRSFALYGPVGRGKTVLAVCALRAHARRGAGSTFYWNMVTGVGNRTAVERGDRAPRLAPCWFESWSRLLSLHRREKWDEEGWFEQLEERVSVLVLDDVGVDAGTPYRESFLLRHVEWASAPGRALILTVNDPPSAWDTVLGERIEARLRNRFLLVRVSP